jgi:hypothetical protein
MNFTRTVTQMMTSTLLAGGVAVGLAAKWRSCRPWRQWRWHVVPWATIAAGVQLSDHAGWWPVHDRPSSRCRQLGYDGVPRLVPQDG